MRLVNCILNKMTEGNFNSMHTDDQPQYKDPVHTAIVYLSGQNVDFTGGEIYFQVENYLISPERNMLVFFEGNVQRPHEVKTVVSGVRQTITMQFTKEEQ
jgi:Rps23 Pro-64 3,4-dihydroxylase Tpa1-like proline 4-hydroxylase